VAEWMRFKDAYGDSCMKFKDACRGVNESMHMQMSAYR
jgi:hypothetical protein